MNLEYEIFMVKQRLDRIEGNGNRYCLTCGDCMTRKVHPLSHKVSYECWTHNTTLDCRLIEKVQ